jgi:heat shock protein HslJ
MAMKLIPLLMLTLGLTGCQWFDRQDTAPPPARTGSLGESIDLTTPVNPSTQPAETKTDPMLFNTTWTLVEVAGEPAMAVEGARPATLQLLPTEGRYAGSTGVNRLSGQYVADGTSITLKPGPMTRMAGPELLMRQESKLLDAMHTTTAYRIEGNTLALLAGERVVARYMKVD